MGREGWRDGWGEEGGGVRAGRKARDEQKLTLASCCSQQQVQSQRGGGAGGLRRDGALLW